MLSLSLFSHMPPDDDNRSAENSASSNAYDFMGKRHAGHVDLTAQRRVARIRSANYASDIAPLCVSTDSLAKNAYLNHIQFRPLEPSLITCAGAKLLEIWTMRASAVSTSGP